MDAPTVIENEIFDVSENLGVSLPRRPRHRVQAVRIGVIVLDSWLRVEHEWNCEETLERIDREQNPNERYRYYPWTILAHLDPFDLWGKKSATWLPSVVS